MAKMTKKEKLAVEVAKDVLAQLKARKYKAEHCYAHLNMKYKNQSYFYQEMNENSSLKDEFNKIKTCEVCAIGSAFMSLVRLDNKFNTSSLGVDNLGDLVTIEREAMVDRLEDIFDLQTIQLLEDCYEHTVDSEFADINNDTARLSAIMKNIIKNNGKFLPELFDEDDGDEENYNDEDDDYGLDEEE